MSQARPGWLAIAAIAATAFPAMAQDARGSLLGRVTDATDAVIVARPDVSAFTTPADVTLASLWSGHPEVTELVIERPVLSVPLLRERIATANPAPKGVVSSSETESGGVTIHRVTITDRIQPIVLAEKRAAPFANPRRLMTWRHVRRR